MYFRIVCIFFFSIISLFSFLSYSGPCSDIFGSRLYYDSKVLQRVTESASLHPNFVDIALERSLQKRWNEEPDTPKLLKFLLPKGVHFIKRQLYQPGNLTAVKLGEWGEEIIARAHYKHGDRVFHTNVAFSTRALLNNLNDGAKHNWLVGTKAKAAILFLHGGGTKSTGFHVGGNFISRFSQYGIDVVSIDLPWHGQGHREFLSAESDIRVLGSFVQKYIPSHVPLFVVGHSWGSVFSEILMRMTDRPPKDFLFHNNLKGTVILSTAVDAAPGQSKIDKYPAYFKRLKQAKIRSQTEAPEAELSIFTNIVRDGKTSPLGGAYSMHFISQLDQSAPIHKGKKYVPALMVVGTKDSLVYFGFEDLYDVYKKLVNVETHYLDKPMKHGKGDIQGVGHDVFGALDPKTEEPIVPLLIRRFIAKQLEFDSLKKNLISEVRSSSHEGSFKARVVESIDSTRSVEELKDFTDHNKTTLEIFDSEKLKDAYAKFIAKSEKSSFNLEKVKSDKLPLLDFIRLMQLMGNDLSFREFLADFIYYDEQKTSTFILNKTTKQKEQIEKVQRVLGNYNTTSARVRYLLENILAAKRLRDLSDLYPEIEFVTTLFSERNDKQSNKKINNENMRRDFITLKEEAERLVFPGAHSRESSNSQLSDIKHQVKQFLEKHSGFFPISNRNTFRKGLIASIINSDNIKQVREQLESENLPPNVMRKTMLLMERYFITEALVSFNYVPLLDMFRELNMPYTRKARALNIIRKLHTVVSLRNERETAYLEANREKNKLKDQYNELLTEVKSNISKLKEIFRNANYQPPPSLVEAHNKSAAELKLVEKAQEEMDKVLDQVFREGEDLQESQVIKMLEERRPAIDNFINIYTQFIQNRRLLREKLIMAGETGKMGKDFKTIITSLYGYGSRGQESVVGPDNKYKALENKIISLAEAEAKVLRLDKLRKESLMEYNHLMNQLQLFVYGNKQIGAKDLELIQEASNLINITEYPLIEILNGEHGNIKLNGGTNKEEVIDYINNYKNIFSKAVNHWNSLQSRSPPLLPTVSD